MSLLPTSHLQSLNGSQYDRNFPSAVLSTGLVSDDPRLVEGFTVVETEAAGRGGNRESTAVSDTLSSRQGELPPHHTPAECPLTRVSLLLLLHTHKLCRGSRLQGRER